MGPTPQSTGAGTGTAKPGPPGRGLGVRWGVRLEWGGLWELRAKVGSYACLPPVFPGLPAYVVPVEQQRSSPPRRPRPPQSPAARPQPPVRPPQPSSVRSSSPPVLPPRSGTATTRPRPVGAPGVRSARGQGLPGLVGAVRRLPDPRLTGLGAGLFASAAMLLFGSLDLLLFDGSPLVYGLLFLPVSALTALWVRAADLVTAPISVPIAFAVGVIPISGGEGGVGGHTMAVITALAVQAGWLYGGTLVAGVITCVRKVRVMGRRGRGGGPRRPG